MKIVHFQLKANRLWLIGWTLSLTAQTEVQNMNENRFPLIHGSTEDYIDGLDNKNTKETTIWDVYLLKNFLKYKNEERELHKIPPEDLYEYLAELMLSVR